MMVGCGPRPLVVGSRVTDREVSGTHPPVREAVVVGAAKGTTPPLPRVPALPGAIGVPPEPGTVCRMPVAEAPGAMRVPPGPTWPVTTASDGEFGAMGVVAEGAVAVGAVGALDGMPLLI
jgi:hypothetical protein